MRQMAGRIVEIMYQGVRRTGNRGLRGSSKACEYDRRSWCRNYKERDGMTKQTDLDERDANGLWRDATCRSAGLVTPRDVDAGIAVLREAVAEGVNHIDTRFLRSACDYPDHQTGASSLSEWTGDRHQSGCLAASGQIVGSLIISKLQHYDSRPRWLPISI
jgi:hypothetical protein